jgi:hypothetical protein
LTAGSSVVVVSRGTAAADALGTEFSEETGPAVSPVADEGCRRDEGRVALP